MDRSRKKPEDSATRRTEGVRVQGRSARIVEQVLESTAEELGRVGFAAMRIEDVATRSGVNKTTIYRRWPTKSELVAAALEKLTNDPEIPDTGCLRDDLLGILRQNRARIHTPQGRGLVRLIQAERAHPEFANVVRRIRATHNEARRVVFERAIERGELPHGSDTALLAEFVMAPFIARLINLDMDADEHFMTTLVDVVLAGARAGAAVTG